MKKLEIPLETARIRPSSNLQVIEDENWLVFGGLVEEGKAVCQMEEQEFFEEGRSNGRLVRVRPDTPTHELSVEHGYGKRWEPDQDALNNIDATTLRILGVGTVSWAGALCSATNPLHAVYSHKEGPVQAGSRKWTWRQAIEALMEAEGLRANDETFLATRRKTAIEYGNAVLKQYRCIRRGQVYGVVVYAIKKGSHKRDQDFDLELWGHIGKEYAIEALNESLTAVMASIKKQNP